MKVYISERVKEVTGRHVKDVYSIKSGEKIGTERRVFASFRRGGLPSWAKEQALERFPMVSKPDSIPAERWLAYWDPAEAQFTHGWTDEELKVLEARVARSTGVVLFEPDPLKAPWPAYDKLVAHGQRKIEHVAAKIVETVQELEIDPAVVILYERQEKNRPEVIAALEALTAPEPEEELVAA